MAKAKKDDLKAVSAQPLDSIDDTKLGKKETKDSGVSEATSKEVPENKDTAKGDAKEEAPIEDIPLGDDNEKKDSTADEPKDVATKMQQTRHNLPIPTLQPPLLLPLRKQLHQYHQKDPRTQLSKLFKI